MVDESGIRITVESQYLVEQSNPQDEHFVFAYTITISNQRPEPCRLLRRHWVITDAAGEVQEVRGEGVVGEQPRLQPGESFRYTSGTVLKTPVGSMQGDYEFVTEAGESFLAPVAAFSLSVPNMVH